MKEYKRTYKRKTAICIKCNVIGRIEGKDEHGNPICRKCNKKRCSKCGEIRRIEKKIDNMAICVNCYCKDRFISDEAYRTKVLIRNRIAESLNKYSKRGKVRRTDEYGINYKKIVEHLGNCPGKREDYHIDHIIPISAFDLNDPIQIKEAFTPENHQWLLAKENLSKSDRYENMGESE